MTKTHDAQEVPTAIQKSKQFCRGCGNQIVVQTPFCPSCGAEQGIVNPAHKAWDNGSSGKHTAQNVDPQGTDSVPLKSTSKKKRRILKFAGLSFAGVFVLAAIIAVLSVAVGGGKKSKVDSTVPSAAQTRATAPASNGSVPSAAIAVSTVPASTMNDDNYLANVLVVDSNQLPAMFKDGKSMQAALSSKDTTSAKRYLNGAADFASAALLQLDKAHPTPKYAASDKAFRAAFHNMQDGFVYYLIDIGLRVNPANDSPAYAKFQLAAKQFSQASTLIGK